MITNSKVKQMILVALFAALTSVGVFINIQLPIIPLTLQTFFCIMAGLVLGSKLGALSQTLYISIGLIGFPIFTKGGGISYVLQPSFGYLIGFIICAYVVGKIVENTKEITITKLFLISIIGLIPIYICGLIYMYGILNFYLHKPTTFSRVLQIGFVFSIGGDILKSYIAALISNKLLKAQNT